MSMYSQQMPGVQKYLPQPREKGVCQSKVELFNWIIWRTVIEYRTRMLKNTTRWKLLDAQAYKYFSRLFFIEKQEELIDPKFSFRFLSYSVDSLSPLFCLSFGVKRVQHPTSNIEHQMFYLLNKSIVENQVQYETRHS